MWWNESILMGLLTSRMITPQLTEQGGLLEGVMGMIWQIIRSGLYSNQISSQSMPYERFWRDTLGQGSVPPSTDNIFWRKEVNFSRPVQINQGILKPFLWPVYRNNIQTTNLMTLFIYLSFWNVWEVCQEPGLIKTLLYMVDAPKLNNIIYIAQCSSYLSATHNPTYQIITRPLLSQFGCVRTG